MDDHLRLAIGYMDGDGTAEINATVQGKEFGGRSSAWFSISQLEKFAGLLLAYPLPTDDHPIIRGGFWNREVPGEIEQLHIGLRAYPVGLRGVVGCVVKLRTPLNDGDKTKVASIVEVELRSSYQALSDFSREMKRLLRAELHHAGIVEALFYDNPIGPALLKVAGLRIIGPFASKLSRTAAAFSPEPEAHRSELENLAPVDPKRRDTDVRNPVAETCLANSAHQFVAIAK